MRSCSTAFGNFNDNFITLSGLGDRDLKRGMIGPDVKELQQMLTSIGFSTGVADGNFGPNTEAAVKSFQHSIDFINPDGIVDVVTLTKLKSIHASKPVAKAGTTSVPLLTATRPSTPVSSYSFMDKAIKYKIPLAIGISSIVVAFTLSMIQKRRMT